ncbi:AAA family ATPase [Sulfurovum sp.]|uniref:AAA family ATPase n=1 Tax=Sulfurovum sp. TaxID=1969726 RepID=UPI0025F0AF21|nr:AAA family ATPase [Sulfurovum sp.]
MVERLYLRDLVTFREVELEFDKGLVVLSGPSGAGKSVLISALLSSFGFTTQGAAALCELSVNKPPKLKSDAYMLEKELTLKALKKEKLRYFIDGQNISKKTLAELFKPYVRYLSVRDKSGFESETLIEMIDDSIKSREKHFKALLKEYKKRYAHYKSKAQELQKIKEDESRLAELIEFAAYEIEKIERIDPQPGEEEKLLKIKQQLSRVDKIRAALEKASGIFELESSIEEVYRLLEKEGDVFFDAMNQLRADFEETQILADELEETDVEEVLDRLSDLTALKNRYGSVEEALIYKEDKKAELSGYENIERDKSLLEQFLDLEYSELFTLAQKISLARQKEAKEIEKRLETYLEALKLPAMHFGFRGVALGETGIDEIEAGLGSSGTATLSGGEFNRLRLALMAVSIDEKSEGQGVLILDEIDANVSGDESIAIATLIAKLSSVYQIFAISHQPHLSAKADQHIVVTKEGMQSRVQVLDDAGRIEEISRIIAGENPTEQAVAFAKKLRA